MQTITNINEWVAKHITKIVGTMWCFYAFSLIAFISFPSALKSHSSVVMVAWISSNFLQLVLLPALMVGQNLQTEKHDEVVKHLNKIHKHLGIK